MNLRLVLEASEVEIALIAAGLSLIAAARYQAYKYFCKSAELENSRPQQRR